MTQDQPDPYEQLVELIEAELKLAGEGRFEELASAGQRRAELTSKLPATPPLSARDPLMRARLVQERLNIELLRGREALLLALGEVERGRQVARGYAPPGRSTPRIVQSA